VTAIDDAFAPADDFEIKRDRWGRYLLPDPKTGEERSWQRVTTFAKLLSDTYNLDQWRLRQAAIGLTQRPDLLALIASTPEPDTKGKADISKAVDSAIEAAGASTGANLGTAIHAMTEALDRGHDRPKTTPEISAKLDDYIATMQRHGLRSAPSWIERVLVNPELDVAGTADRFVHCPDGHVRIADLKGLDVTTPLPTPDGWTTMGAVSVGDAVIDSTGRPCAVTAKSEVHHKDCYRVTFDDGTSIVADHDHRWIVDKGRADAIRRVVMTTREMAGEVFSRSKQSQRHLRVPVAAPIDLPEADLPIDPYVLGCWIGDGSRSGGVITNPLAEVWAEIENRGYQLGVEQAYRDGDCRTHTVLGLRTQLRLAGLLGHKVIPDTYLRSSIDQRLDLLRGLMDTDGTWNKARKSARFYTVDKALASQVVELLCSLGQKPGLYDVERTGFGLTVMSHDVEFTPLHFSPFLARPDQIQGHSTSHSKRRIVHSVEPTVTVPTQCIEVDSPDHSYLCGEKMIVTHNTGKSVNFGHLEFAMQLAAYATASGMWNGSGWDDMPANLDTTVGYIIHLPAQVDGPCTIHEVDLVAGIHACRLAVEVRNVRRRKGFLRGVDAPVPEADKDRRLDLLRRCRSLDVERRAAMKAKWPAEIPGLTTDHHHSDLELDAIEAVLEVIDGTRVATEVVEALLKRVQALPGDLLLAVDHQAKEALVPHVSAGWSTDNVATLTPLIEAAENVSAERHMTRVRSLGEFDDEEIIENICAFANVGRLDVGTRTLDDLAHERVMAAIETLDLYGSLIVDEAVAVEHHGSKRDLISAARAVGDRHHLDVPRSASDIAADPLLVSLTFLHTNTQQKAPTP